ncbi:glycolate oxidase [Teratosphaeria destructans]|uniref:D-lactate dehydrogenase (cytochrome) n=1 Tax=Teratosphaeria destructans TaxID=418781 RepID=A0A9W7T103_9PEZI|nr:glycolate oxidase [Teratosphaeria destructans]
MIPRAVRRQCSPVLHPHQGTILRTASFWRRLRPDQAQHCRRLSTVRQDGASKRGIPSASTLILAASALLGAGAALGAAVAAKDSQSTLKHGLAPYASKHEMIKVERLHLNAQAAHKIAHELGENCVTFDGEAIEAHSQSEWSSINTPNRPVAIVYPHSTEHVSRIAQICSERAVPMVPYGAGSSVEGNFSSPHSGICVDFTFMDRIIAFHPDDMDVVVQPGVNWMDLNTRIREHGLFLPLDPSPTATIGGMVSTNCSGTNAFRYGTMKDWVINVTVVLADGRVVKTRQRPRKSSAGYNLTSLFVGAEGTLGFVTEITLKLAPIPEHTGVAAVSFPTTSSATMAAVKLIRSGIQLGALEIMDAVQMGILNKHGSQLVKQTKWDEMPTLLLKFSGTRKGVQEDISRTRDITASCNAATFRFARNKTEEAALWAARKEALWTMVSIQPEGHKVWSTDVAVPISRLGEIIAASQTDANKLGLFNSIVGHVGDGNFHQSLFYESTNEKQKQMVSDHVHAMVDRAVAMDGTVSGEHAIGLGKKDCLITELGEDTIDLMRTVKAAVDPKWIMNPGKVFDLQRSSR